MTPLIYRPLGLPDSVANRFPNRLIQCTVDDIFAINWEQCNDSEVSLTYDCEVQGLKNFITYEHLFRVIGDEVHEVLNDGSTVPVHEHFDQAENVLRFRHGEHLNDVIHEHSRSWFQH